MSEAPKNKAHPRVDCGYVWRAALTPDEREYHGMKSGRLRSCSWCGSMHPDDLAAAVRAGAKLSWADWKYGWPHKAYVEGVPNPHAGLLEVRDGSYCSTPPKHEIDAGKWERFQDGFDPRTGDPCFTYRSLGPAAPAPALTHGKFYTEHLQDATPEDRDVIERAMGLRFEFDGKGVGWKAYQ